MLTLDTQGFVAGLSAWVLPWKQRRVARAAAAIGFLLRQPPLHADVLKITRALAHLTCCVGTVEAHLTYVALAALTPPLTYAPAFCLELFAQVAGAGMGHRKDVAALRQTFLPLLAVADAQGLDTDDVLGVIQALCQMLSRGEVSVEQLACGMDFLLPGVWEAALVVLGHPADVRTALGRITDVPGFFHRLATALRSALEIEGVYAQR